ncbi:lysM and putative peptidoglycan-binding domain-containing protein 4 [Corythoichthys intestinalis]|uniref:lysM and putative peptidoglycan-binding domain-containing protein 4 n=1 Tax=Corythoichthys intestinalis TaxID=161448 RepID=UPI0025A5066A|nr:lysM and putative peptidoglycan-binding domain-containing protein 4 [Corythoichthys intestinalis]XP_061812831.1 lysM and putative peptidoglycan-binding domain-containing protein 4-like [Nerophis lumbriciformis]
MRRVEHVPHAFQAPVDVHASADGQVYMFKRKANGTAASSDDEEELGLMEMRPRILQETEQDRMANFHFLERDLLDDDNLNKLALQYGCKVADIKRANNLIQEQDLFALKSIKIPVPKHSFLMESITDMSDSLEETPVKVQPHRKQVMDFLIEVDNDTEKLIPPTDDCDVDLLDVGPKGSTLKGHKGQGADWGIQWWNAVVAMLLIGIVLPLFYVIYFKTKHSGGAASEDGTVTSSFVTSNNTFGTGGPEPG